MRLESRVRGQLVNAWARAGAAMVAAREAYARGRMTRDAYESTEDEHVAAWEALAAYEIAGIP